jgi:hypothetical protein
MAILGLLAAWAGAAGELEAAEARFDVPFAFTVKDRLLPPGTYQVSTGQGTLLIRGADMSALVVAHRLESLMPSGRAWLVFTARGGRHSLRAAWLGGGIGRELPGGRGARDGGTGTYAAARTVTLPALSPAQRPGMGPGLGRPARLR